MSTFQIFRKSAKVDEKTKIQNKPSGLSFKQGILMWGILLAGYILFVVNWLLLGNLGGTIGNPGWVSHFFGTTAPNTVVTEAINFTITFMRGVGSLIVGWLIVKLTHKWAVVISLVFVLLAVPAALMPAGIGGYIGFIIFRMLLAIGGTTLIIYVQPVLAKSMTQKQKGIFSIISPFGFNVGTIIATIPFLFIANQLRIDWQIVAGSAAATAIIPLILYILFGKNFDTASQTKLNSTDEVSLPSSSLKILKEKQTWVWVVVYGAWLVVAVIPLFPIFRTALTSLSNASGLGLSTNEILFSHNIMQILYVAGIFLAPLTIGRWNFSNARRKPFVVFIGSMILVAMACMLLGWAYGSIATFYVFAFLAGWFTWSIQGVILNNPHERKGNTPKRIGVLFSFIWGFGYFFFTIANIILAIIVPVGASLGFQIGMLAAFFVISALFPIGFLFVKETKVGGKLIPDGLKFWRKAKR
ncbi:hexose phosphate transporter [[Mycoplasma] mobile]|uniref:Unspecified transport or permease protein n=1 Tax=Mycoplasma mobile (strain ATCC 43663 / 163K / NCTC 11711) TaxID=267748 RepID=Q6KIP8_MYCM1|nr:hexose phosphate transporter [[Mycoplasma] mobile]AAT27528.1 unspecified transport or permease protein [Mycoplasma mobile 163K]